jgi:transcriptional regulator with XRE-family HTH domain
MATTPATIVREARLSSGLSIRALAARAEVAASTITRIEAGSIDPTVGTLRDILRATGRALHLESPPAARVHLAELHGAWNRRHGEDRPDWTVLRAGIDHLALHPEETADAIAPAPGPSGSVIVDALLAAIADKLADDLHLARPPWTRAAPTLSVATFLMPTTPRQRHAIRRSTPPQLATRNLFVDETTLWRAGTAIDA